MRQLRLYHELSRARWLNYRGKIMLTAFVGTHVPLIALVCLLAFWSASNLHDALVMIGVALGATLAGTAVTLAVLNGLLQPILLTARGLRSYAADRSLPSLPTHYQDEVGLLMADADRALRKLDKLVDDLAHYDPVTALPNCESLLHSLRPVMRDAAKPFGLGLIRLADHARLVATFGQQAADRVLRALSGRLEAATTAEMKLARLDGNTFGLILPMPEGADGLAHDLQSLVAKASAEIQVDTIAFVPEVLASVAMFPHDCVEAEDLVNSAVLALEGATPTPTGKIAFFAPAAREAAMQRFTMEQELRRGLEDNQLLLHYQPAIDLSAGKALSAEALVRWQHPRLGMVSPAVFVPLAEQTGLADELGTWVLRTACAQARAWRNDNVPLKVGVNISARQFCNPAFVKSVGDILAANGINGGNLEVELTETAAMDDAAATARVFGALRELGISIAIDDFGSGYSSLSYLKNLPFDRLKIDREFVRGVGDRPDSRAICKAIIELGKGLDLEVVAEGTETAQEVRALRALGCHIFQGFYFAKPAPAADLMALLTKSDWSDRQELKAS